MARKGQEKDFGQEPGLIRRVEETLSDGSIVHNVELTMDDGVVTFHAVDESAAVKIARQLETMIEKLTTDLIAVE